MSEQPPGQGWAGGLGREQYPPSSGAGLFAQPSYQATQGQPPWETPQPGPAPGAAPSGQPSGPAAPGPAGPGAGAGPAYGADAAYGAGGARGADTPHGSGAASGHGHGLGAGSGRGARQRPQLPLEESKNFLNALFDFGFTSFVTPKVVKVLYLLIVIVVGLSALAFAVTMLASNLALGLVVLLIGAPLYFLVVTALYRITLEFFMVIFRMAEDIRALRERGEIR
ncbi:MAG: DUF4282 domain-containing protein [Streptosporangiales bacterium]